ncbi:response regulator transcription factor [Cohnella fermenti]|uniref:response regulator transcription factor n=1 Tax=Cohnella fermenti TaxID=2565925 RepID=UPI001454B97D|nr:response regulator [Cohnella fermenti]
MKIIIVDDEAIFRDYLRQALEWESYGMSISGEARNGEEALALMRADPPDVALVDINMPIMDGLELTERLRAEGLPTDVVLVTGHNEFEYARTAIRLGVEDYILKPFSKDELVLTLLKCRNKRQIELKAKQTERADRELMLGSALQRLVTGETAQQADAIAGRLEQFGLDLSERHSVAVIEIDHMERKWNEPAERQLWKFAVTNILQETLEEEGDVFLFHGAEGRIVILRKEGPASGAARTGEGKAPPKLDGYDKVCRYIRKYLKLTVTIGVGGGYSGPEGIRRSYEEAREALRSKFLLGEDRVIDYASLDPGSAGTSFLAESNDRLAHALRMGDWSELELRLDGLFREIRERKLSLDLTYVSCMGWVSVALSHVTEAGHPIEDCFGEHFFPYSDIRALETVDAVKEWMKSLFRQAFDYVGKHKKTRSSNIAKGARQLIEEKYGDPELTVEAVAGSLFINPSYLRAVFKKAYGMTASEYLIHVRMEKAKELIGGGLKHSDIAERVGFNDPGYFSKSFRKFFGLSPSEYENGLTRG